MPFIKIEEEWVYGSGVGSEMSSYMWLKIAEKLTAMTPYVT